MHLLCLFNGILSLYVFCTRHLSITGALYFARLLDRDQIIAEEQLEDEVESDFLKGFKVSVVFLTTPHVSIRK